MPDTFCSSCGAKVELGISDVCPNCGEKVKPAPAPAARAPAPAAVSGKNPVLAAILSFIIPGLGQVYNGQILKAIGIFVAFIIGIPDMTAGIRKAKGKLLPFGFIRILRASRKTKQLDLLLGGIKESYRGIGLDVLMGVAEIKSAQEAGFEVMDTHHEMETNVKVRGEMERMGGILYKKFRVYTKNL